MSNDIRAALEPCPFCGSEASLEDERLLWVVRCSGCGACVLGDRALEPEQELPESYWEPFRQSAVDRWNRRPAAPPAPLEGEVRELISVIESCAGFTDESTLVGEVWAKIVALLEQLSAAVPAVVPDGPAVPESREPASVAPEATAPRPLSPAAQAVLDAFNREARPEPHHQREAIAAALRAVADQVVPEGGVFLSTASAARTRRDVLAIAAELEGCDV